MANVDIKEYIELDSSFITKVEDAQKMIIKPMIQELLDVKNEELLGEFEIYVQPIEMIIADKFFAICKNYRRGNVERYSRHFYDIYEAYTKIIGKKQISKNNLKRYIREVADAEKIKYSENENVEVKYMKDVLIESINSKDYRMDYSKDLPKYIYGKNMPTYDQCCEVIKRMVDDGLFDGINHYFIKKKKEKNKNEKIFIYEFVKKDISEIKNLTQQEMFHKYYDGDKKLAIQKIEELREKLLNEGKMFNKTKYYITKVEGFKDIYFIVGQNITRGIAVDIVNIEIK